MKHTLWILAVGLLAALPFALRTPSTEPDAAVQVGEFASVDPTPEPTEPVEDPVEDLVERVDASRMAGDLTLVVSSEMETGGEAVVAFFPVEGGPSLEFDVELGLPRAVHVPPGRYEVRPSADANDGATLLWPDRVQVPDEPVTVPLELWFAPAANLEVRALDVDGAPLEDVPVQLERTGERRVRRLLRTDAEGRVNALMPAGPYSWTIPSRAYEVLPDDERSALAGALTLEPQVPARLEVVLAVPEERALEVELLLTTSDGVLDPGRVTDLEVRWRGRAFLPRLAEDGAFRARRTVPEAGEASSDQAFVRVRGRGLREVEFAVPDPGTDVDRLTIRRELEPLDGRVACLFVDRDGNPLPGRRLDLRVRQSPESTSYRHDEVYTDARGRFEIRGVAVPFQFFVANEVLGRRYHPNDVRPMRIPVTDRLVKVYELPAHRVVLHVDDADVASAAARSQAGPTLLDVLPLGRIESQLRTPWADSLKELTAAASQRLAGNGTIELGDLPAGEYLATLFVASHGTLVARFTVDPARGLIEVPLDYRPGGAGSGRIEPGGAALVVDGYVPRTLLARIQQNAAVEESAGERLRGGWTTADAGGSFSLSAHNALLSEWTVVYPDGRVARLQKGTGSSGGGDAFRSDGDGVLQGRVLAADGSPAAGVAVNLTSVRGGERGGVVAWPKAEELLGGRTDTDGRFELGGITPGSYTVSVADLELSDGGRTRRFLVESESVRLVDVFPGVQVLDLRLEPESTGHHAAACDHPGHAH